MRRVLQIASLISAAGFAAGGFRLLFNASRADGWDAAVPALSGCICFVVAACLIAPQLVGFIAWPVNALVGAVFHPPDRFTTPPDAILNTLRRRIQDGRFDHVERDLAVLSDAYGPQPELYHLRALLVAARGESALRITMEASSALSAKEFEIYLARLRDSARG